MSNKDDQNIEVEALESIFPEIEVIETDPFHALRFTLKTEKYDEDPDNEARIVLVFRFTAKYPEEGPKVEIEETENILDENDVLEFLKKQADENLGMPMVYTLVCALIEKLNKDNEDRKILEKEEKERLERQREEEELKKFEGTKVSVESFLKWKAQFDKEMSELKKQTVENSNKKVTGKQLFERDETLFNSDLQYIAEGDQVEVDESLFQDMEDLDIEDDEDDEYIPDEDDDEEE